MAERPGRRNPRVTTARVLRVDRLTPRMTRVVLGGPGLAGFTAGRFTDHYVKLLFPVPGVAYPEPFDLRRIRDELPRDRWPRTRTYTVRRWDAERRELSVDLLHHGDKGLAGPWAVRVRPGDAIRFAGPGGGYAPDPAVGHHLLAGDETAWPAVAATLERLPPGVRAVAYVEVAGPEEEQPVTTAADATVHWLHRNGGRVGDALLRAVRDAPAPPADDVQAFVHGEAGFVRDLRRLLRTEWGVPGERLSASGYWRLGQDEDGWQASKRDWNRSIEEEDTAP
ncbi:siderophore-interacting protein [Streptomyces sp. RFCAC02]|uniref:siderophore-interacting protein n=1 Tax=Streptomyces sp. RFCAC02 TaxID=2499143 RepID=UPI0010220CCB|nr:siderophore-interacting protein [Streptomyces sp. RFCAC02]